MPTPREDVEAALADTEADYATALADTKAAALAMTTPAAALLAAAMTIDTLRRRLATEGSAPSSPELAMATMIVNESRLPFADGASNVRILGLTDHTLAPAKAAFQAALVGVSEL